MISPYNGETIMSIIFSEPRYIKVSYRTFSQVSNKGEPCGGFSYYADAFDAADRGDYVELVISSTDTLAPKNDLMGKPFIKLEWEKAPEKYKQKYMNAERKLWDSRT